jgi:hypothetical protein
LVRTSADPNLLLLNRQIGPLIIDRLAEEITCAYQYDFSSIA